MQQPTGSRELVVPAAEPTRERKGVTGWVADNPLAAVTLVGLVLYGFLRFSSGVFYGRLGFSPEQVGLSYSAMLARSAYALLYLAIVSPFVSVCLLVLVILVVSIWVGLIKRRWREVFAHILPIAAGIVILAAVFAFLGTSWGMLELSFDDVDSVKKGEPVGTLDPLDWGTYLSWPAQAAMVYPTDGGTLPFGSCVLYLGEADGYTALFDPKTDTAWRVPSGGVTIETGGELSSVKHVPQGCPAEPIA